MFTTYGVNSCVEFRNPIDNMIKFFSLILIMNFSFSYGQDFEFGVVQDKEGFTNIRSSNNVKENNIIDKLENGFIVNYFGIEGNWIYIDYEKNGKSQNGYIYKDKVQSIYKFTKIPINKVLNDEIIFSDKKIEIKINLKPFVASQHFLSFSEENANQLIHIDGKDIFGTDGNIPKTEYGAIEINFNTLKFKLPSEAIKNLYEPNLEYTNAYFDNAGETLYIQTLNGDGAGGYAVLWTIEKGIYKKRTIAIPF